MVPVRVFFGELLERINAAQAHRKNAVPQLFCLVPVPLIQQLSLRRFRLSLPHFRLALHRFGLALSCFGLALSCFGLTLRYVSLALRYVGLAFRNNATPHSEH